MIPSNKKPINPAININFISLNFWSIIDKCKANIDRLKITAVNVSFHAAPRIKINQPN